MRMVGLLLGDVVFEEKPEFKVDRICRCPVKVACGCGTGIHSSGNDHCLVCSKYFRELPKIGVKRDKRDFEKFWGEKATKP